MNIGYRYRYRTNNTSAIVRLIEIKYKKPYPKADYDVKQYLFQFLSVQSHAFINFKINDTISLAEYEFPAFLIQRMPLLLNERTEDNIISTVSDFY